MPDTASDPARRPARPLVREPLPARRNSWTQTALIDGQRFYATFGEYGDGRLGEIWVECKTEGTFARGTLGAMARSVSIALQCGTPVTEVVKMLRGLSFPPSGEVVADFTEVRSATSVADWLAQEIQRYYVDPPPARPATPELPPPDPFARLRQLGQALADRWGEKVLLVAGPPPADLGEGRRAPYCVLLSVAAAAERAAAAECLEPRSKTDG